MVYHVIALLSRMDDQTTFSVSPGVLVLSWYPPGLADDNGEPAEDLVSAVLDAAYRHSLKVKKAPELCVCVREKDVNNIVLVFI